MNRGADFLGFPSENRNRPAVYRATPGRVRLGGTAFSRRLNATRPRRASGLAPLAVVAAHQLCHPDEIPSGGDVAFSVRQAASDFPIERLQFFY